MEDCAHIVPRGRCGFLFAAVFDGHSGFAAANYLSDHLYEVFSEAIDEGNLWRGVRCRNVAPG